MRSSLVIVGEGHYWNQGGPISRFTESMNTIIEYYWSGYHYYQYHWEYSNSSIVHYYFISHHFTFFIIIIIFFSISFQYYIICIRSSSSPPVIIIIRSLVITGQNNYWSGPLSISISRPGNVDQREWTSPILGFSTSGNGRGRFRIPGHQWIISHRGIPLNNVTVGMGLPIVNTGSVIRMNGMSHHFHYCHSGSSLGLVNYWSDFICHLSMEYQQWPPAWDYCHFTDRSSFININSQ